MSVAEVRPTPQTSFMTTPPPTLSEMPFTGSETLTRPYALSREPQVLTENLSGKRIRLEDEILSEPNFAEVVGRSSVLRGVLRQVEIVAPTDSAVLIQGETGTGKELIARAIHNLSGRRGRPFVKLNCAAIPSGWLESELFGHEKGAFTGAIMRKAGRFEIADKGTFFSMRWATSRLKFSPSYCGFCKNMNSKG